MKSETRVRRELELLDSDLKLWREKFARVDVTKPDGAARRQMLGNTVNALEGRIEALEWVLKGD